MTDTILNRFHAIGHFFVLHILYMPYLNKRKDA